MEKPFFGVFRGFQRCLTGQWAWAGNYWNVAHSQPEKGVFYGMGVPDAPFGEVFP